MEIRKATINDLEELTRIEAECFPATEAATEESFRGRLEVYPDFFGFWKMRMVKLFHL